MAEMVLRQRRRRKDRMLDEKRRIPLPTREQVGAIALSACEAAPGLLLAMADLLAIPSWLHGAYCIALAAQGKAVWKPLAGALAAMLLRLLSGVDPRWEGLIGMLLVLLAPWGVHGRGNPALMGFTALTSLPVVVAGALGATAQEMIMAFSAGVISALAAPLMYRGISALDELRRGSDAHCLESMEARLCAGFLVAMLLCGGARLMVAGVNTGMLLAASLVLLAGLLLGAGAGCAAGMIAGMALALQGLPVMLSVALALGGFLAGIVHALGRRWLSCAAFLLGGLLPLLLSESAGLGCGAAVVLAAAGCALLPRASFEACQAAARRLLPVQSAPGDAYAASMLAAWEKTVDAMALAVPSPVGESAARSPAWWERHLCEGCPEVDACGCMNTEHAAERAETVWDCREADEPIWQDALEQLRGLGCQRLYHLRQNMTFLRQEDAAERRHIRRAVSQRDMLVTHLTAMAGAARRFAMLSGGESWWDDVTARRIRRELADRALPVRLAWVRRVQGHALASFELKFITGARRQAEELALIAAGAVGAPMEVVRVDGDRVSLAEMPLLMVSHGVCSAAFGLEEADRQCVCGDTAWCGRLQDGRCMAALSDGMGHGERAALASRQTVELLRLCLDAGYTRRQTLTAVNGMMLLSGHGERFTTVDLLTIDLWSGQAALDKLGAAGSWVYQQGELRQMTGDALPLGIIENVESRECGLRLRDGDAVILLTDGVEEAFPSRQALEEAVWLALGEDTPQMAAECLLKAAEDAEPGGLRDDMTVVFIRIHTSGAVQSTESIL